MLTSFQIYSLIGIAIVTGLCIYSIVKITKDHDIKVNIKSRYLKAIGWLSFGIVIDIQLSLLYISSPIYSMYSSVVTPLSFIVIITYLIISDYVRKGFKKPKY